MSIDGPFGEGGSQSSRPLRVISLGAGVQSSAMLLMALEGRFGDKPDCAIFADTQWEREATYDWLEEVFGVPKEIVPGSDPIRYRATVGTWDSIGIPIHVVTAGDIRQEAHRGGPWGRRDGRPFVTLPMYTVDGVTWAKGQGRRQCTKEYKLEPIRKWIRANAKNAEVWIGISKDEAHRSKPSRIGYITNRFPILEIGLSREACDQWTFERTGKHAPDSACAGCPFKGDDQWSRLRSESPSVFQDVVDADKSFRHIDPLVEQFIHRSLIPLGDIKEFRHEKQGRMFVDAFGNECEGMCGL